MRLFATSLIVEMGYRKFSIKRKVWCQEKEYGMDFIDGHQIIDKLR